MAFIISLFLFVVIQGLFDRKLPWPSSREVKK